MSADISAGSKERDRDELQPQDDGVLDFEDDAHNNDYNNNSYDSEQDEDSPDANKENYPPLMDTMNLDLEQDTHATWYQSAFDDGGDGRLRELDGLQPDRSGTLYVDEEDYAGGSFDPLSLSFRLRNIFFLKVRFDRGTIRLLTLRISMTKRIGILDLA
jgi:hypothetical protein